MKKWLVGLLILITASSMVFAGGEGEGSESYPSKPVTLVIPWGMGGGTDLLARSLLSVMGNYFPQPMVPINKPGGGSTIGTTEVLKSKPDGYTILINGFGAFCTQPHLSRLEYTPDDWRVVLQVNKEPRILVANNDAPYNTMREMIEYAKAHPEEIKVALADIGTTGHLGMAKIEMDFGVKFTYVPQGGGGQQRLAVIGGHCDIAPPTSAEIGPYITQSQVKALGVMDEERFADLPDIPTLAEEGFPNKSITLRHIFVPAETPDNVVKVLHDAFKGCLEDEGFLAMTKKLNLIVAYKDGEKSREELMEFYNVYGVIIDNLGLAKQ